MIGQGTTEQIVRRTVCSLLPVWLGCVLLSGQFADTGNRWWMRDYYNAIMVDTPMLEIGWTGRHQPPTPGTISADWQATVLERINFYRHVAGVPANITFDLALSRKAQEAALMMSLANQLSHYPPETWNYYTADGAEAASRSNLGLGLIGPDAITAYMVDYGDGNKSVGHRRWLLYPQTTTMGNGDVPATVELPFSSANALWVVPNGSGMRPATRDGFVAWPPPGNIPSSLVPARWSFSFPKADFSNASVRMQRNGRELPVRLEPLETAIIGEPTIVWIPDNLDTNVPRPWPLPSQDETITVSIRNVIAQGQSQNFDYTVNIFNPTMAGSEESRTRVSLRSPYVHGAPAQLQVSSRPWAEAVDIRLLRASAEPPPLDAEDGLLPFVGVESLPFVPLNHSRRASGSNAYALWHVDATDVTLQLDRSYAVDRADASLRFASSLAWATESQVAYLEIRVAQSGKWLPLWSKSGFIDNNISFETVEIPLGAFESELIDIRFRYAAESKDGNIFYYPGTMEQVGWAIDDIRFSGLSRIDEELYSSSFAPGSAITIPIPAASHGYIQARERAFGDRPLALGPLQPLAALLGRPSGILTSPENWVDDPIIGWNFLHADRQWTFTYTMGWVAIGNYPWIYTGAGWFYHLIGDMVSGIWLYSPQLGYTYSRMAWNGWFWHEPFLPASTGRFGG